MVAYFEPGTGQSAASQDHVCESTGALLPIRWPATFHSCPPLTNDCIPHGTSFFFCHRSGVSLQIKVCFAGTVLPDYFIKATVAGDLQKIGDKLNCTVEGTKPFAHAPLLPCLASPVICRYVEG
jgi:hypothetical protein